MGYYTYYSMNVRGIKSEEEFKSLQHAMYGKEEGIGQIIGYALNRGNYWDGGSAEFSGNDPVKWYDHDEDMIALSKKFPNMTFQLHGDGDQNIDMWDSYYKNGEMETCMAEITIPKPEIIKWD